MGAEPREAPQVLLRIGASLGVCPQRPSHVGVNDTRETLGVADEALSDHLQGRGSARASDAASNANSPLLWRLSCDAAHMAWIIREFWAAMLSSNAGGGVAAAAWADAG